MITEWFIGIGSDLTTWALGALGTDDPASWFTTVGTFITNILASVAGLGAWVPWGIAIAVWGTATAVWTAGLLLKVARWLLGLIPTMGGS